MEIIKPPIDNREYKYLILDNKLQVVIINDKQTNISSVSLSVNIGYYNDQPDTPGLAHFLEHMIFMGSKKYPNVDQFMGYLNKYGGVTNAFTTFNMTNYYFNITTPKFKKAFDIFYNLFHKPLFKSETINKEINNVNSEHEKNKYDDKWRLMEVLKHSSNQEYPFSKFGTGKTNTLSKENIREELKKIFKLYSPNLMKLIIYTNISTDSIERLVKSTFSNLINKNTISNNLPSTLPIIPKLINMNTINDINSLNIYFAMPSFMDKFKTKTMELILFLLNHEGTNTLSDILEKKDLSYDFMASELIDDGKYCIIYCEFTLTKHGSENIPLILSLFNNYIKLLSTTNLEKYFDEQQINNQLVFNYSQKYDSIKYVNDIQDNINEYPIKYMLYGPFYYKKYDDSLIKSTLNYFDLNKSTIIICNKNKIIHNKLEPYYKIKYKEDNLDIKLTDSLYILELPTKNKYTISKIPHTKFNDVPNVNKVYNESNIEVWHTPSTFNIPKTIITIAFINNYYDDIKKYLLTDLYINLIAYKYKSLMYYASVADNNISVGLKLEYYYITFDAYNSIIYDLVDDFNIKDQTFDLFSFEYVKNSLLVVLENYMYKPLNKLSMLYACKKIYPIYHSFTDQLATLKNITYEEFSNDLLFLNNNSIKILVYGHLNKERLISYTNKFKNNITVNMTNLVIPKDGKKTYEFKNLNKKDNNSSILMLYQLDYIKNNKNWHRTIILMNILVNMISNDFFNELRSIKQLGYLVKCDHIKLGSIMKPMAYICFFVQSPKYNPDKLEKEILEFIKNIKIDNIEKYKNNLMHKLNEPFNNSISEFSYLFSEIINGSLSFNYREKLKKHLTNVSKKDIIAFYEAYLLNGLCKTIKIYSKKN